MCASYGAVIAAICCVIMSLNCFIMSAGIAMVRGSRRSKREHGGAKLCSTTMWDESVRALVS